MLVQWNQQGSPGLALIQQLYCKAGEADRASFARVVRTCRSHAGNLHDADALSRGRLPTCQFSWFCWRGDLRGGDDAEAALVVGQAGFDVVDALRRDLVFGAIVD